MAIPVEIRSSFEEANRIVQQTFQESGIQAGSQVTPDQLGEAISQFLFVFDKLDNEHGESGPILFDDVNQLGDHAIGFLMDLAYWAERLRLPKSKIDIEKTALGVAHWIIRHEGELRTLEPLVNSLAASANLTQDADTLKALVQVAGDIIDHASPSIQADLEKHDATRPWRILNFNYAIVATRAQDPALMRKAFDTLGRNLPDDCPDFFEQGMQQAQKDTFTPAVREIMQEYFNRWATRH
ncbi:MAG: hypothetical protein P4L77_15055 [Sulfuriferula sp.]|nr:hypothetical protein [Sulfuriferula sp.]